MAKPRRSEVLGIATHPENHQPSNPVAEPKTKHTDAVQGGEEPTAWGPAAAIIGTIFLYVFGQLIGGFIASIYPRLRGWDYNRRIDWLTNTVIGQFWYVLVVEALTLAAVLWYVKKRKGTYAQLGLTRPKLKDVVYAVGGFFIYVVGLYFTLYVIVKPIFRNIDLSQHQDVGFGTVVTHRDLVLTFISLVILPPLVEEIIFRGFLFGGLKRKLPVMWAGVLTSLMFAAPHLLESDNGKLLWVAGVDTFVLSLVLVTLRHKTGRLYSGMLVHGAKNYLAFTYLYHAVIFIR